MNKTTYSYVVENLDSKGFFLILNFADANPEFTSYIEHASNYSSLDLAESVMERVRGKGFTMNMQAKQLITTYTC